MKLFFFVALSLACSLTSLSQSAKEYFMPLDDKNQSLYFTPNPSSGLRTSNEQYKYFVSKLDYFIVLTVNLSDGQISSATEEKIKMTNNDIFGVSMKSGSVLTKGPSEIKYNPPRPLLKVPKTDTDYQSWSYVDGTETTKCTAVFSDLNIGGEKKKAILVLKNVYEKSKYVEWASTKEFYVAGIGLYKILTMKDEVFMMLDYQRFEPNPPISKEN